MKEEFTEKLRLNKKNQEQLEVINSIIEEYARDGYVLTLRQLYYQLVSRDIIPNEQKEYAKLSTLLVKGRMAGVVDWDAIEDRIRVPNIPYSVDDIEDAIQDTIDQYRLNRQDGQDVYIELWVEKDALSGVLKRITHYYHINLMVNRGYSSCTAMHDAYERFVKKVAEGKKVVVLYLGDHDPSGLDMVRDITDRTREFLINSDELHELWHEKCMANNGNGTDDVSSLRGELEEEYLEYSDEKEKRQNEFIMDEDGDLFPNFAKMYACKLFDEQVEIRQIGLTTEQVKQYAPPPNPAKITDPRAKNYIAQFGNTSWEVDALKPEILHSLVREGVEGLIDMKLFKDQIKKEESDKGKLKKFFKEKKK
ncbi:hypothetical protein LCGC14_0462590 [marine sediment metagenome]|uniref:Uncharacterized protein n=1 Tax=marine sediment metagenome TaxID=412755 RepID=A0A0F9SEV7_9ZZZZ